MARRRKTKRSRKRNPNFSNLDGRAALALALVGGAIGGGAAAIAGQHGLLGRTSIGMLVGGTLGGIMGALLPKSRASNPAVEGLMMPLSMNPMKNPLGATTAIVAGTVLGLVPAAIAIDVMSQKTPSPSVVGTYGIRKLHVIPKGKNWAWQSEDLGGAALTRRGALEAALGELAPLSGPNDHVELHFERPTLTLEVAPLMGSSGWSWALSTGEAGTEPTRGAALIAGLDVVESFGEPL